VQGQYVRRRFEDFIGLVDTGSVWEPVQRTDPGPDGRLGTSDDGGSIDVFRLVSSQNAFNLYTNPPGAYNRYDAVQLIGRKRYSDGWQLQSSYTWSRTRGTVGNRAHVNAGVFDLGNPGTFVNPNRLVNADGRATFDPTHEVKLLGSYRVAAWGGIMASSVYRYTTGQAWARNAQISGLPGSYRVRMEPQGAQRAPAINTMSLRVEKTMAVPRTRATAGLFFDVFNVWNQGVPDSDVINAVNDNAGSRFGEPNFWIDPRTLRVGVRASF
jgi:hypothetical protein